MHAIDSDGSEVSLRAGGWIEDDRGRDDSLVHMDGLEHFFVLVDGSVGLVDPPI